MPFHIALILLTKLNPLSHSPRLTVHGMAGYLMYPKFGRNMKFEMILMTTGGPALDT
jgi:hypothetical protein